MKPHYEGGYIILNSVLKDSMVLLPVKNQVKICCPQWTLELFWFLKLEYPFDSFA